MTRRRSPRELERKVEDLEPDGPDSVEEQLARGEFLAGMEVKITRALVDENGERVGRVD